MMNNSEAGAATLLISLMVLLIMTLLVISSININAINYKIAGNMQAQKMVDAATLQGLEEVMSQSNNFAAGGTDQSVDVGVAPGDPTAPAYTVTVSAPVCISSQVMSGFSAVWDMSPDENTWEIVSELNDGSSGANARIHQGVKIQQLSGSCP